MTLLNRLTKAKKLPPGPRDKVAALADKSQAELQAIVYSDAAEATREAAVARLEYCPDLLRCAQDDAGSRLRLAARKRLGEMLEQQAIALDRLQRDLPDPWEALVIGSYSPRVGQQILENVTEPQALLQLAIHGASVQVRQAAAQKLSNRPELEQLLKAAQGRDKAVYRIAKTRLDVFKAEDARQAEQQAQARVICEKLEQLARVDADPLYEAKLTKLQDDWQALDASIVEELQHTYHASLQLCQDQLAAKTRQLAVLEQKRRQTEATQQELQQCLATSAELILGLCAADEGAQAGDDFARQFSQLRANLERLKADQAGDGEVRALCERMAAAESLLDTLKRSDGTPEASPSRALKRAVEQVLDTCGWTMETAPAPVTTLWQRITEQEQLAASAKRRQRKRIQQLEQLVRRGLGAARSGQVRKARGIHRAAAEEREKLQELPAALVKQLEKLDQAIEQLSDWHEFAVTPKKQALIKQMQALQDSALPAEELATKIHKLQDDWREVSKGVPHADESLWQEFKAASDIAFTPCKQHFDDLAKQRENNQAGREQLIEQLRYYLDNYTWDDPVWSDVERTFRQARDEWRRYWPVPRHASKDQDARFEPLMDLLHARLKEHYDANKAAREILIARAAELAQQDNLEQAIAGIKQLQQRWKDIGKCLPKDSKKLWKQFRHHCDAAFVRREQAHQAANQASLAEQDTAEAIIAQLSVLAAQPATAVAAEKAQLVRLKAEFEALTQLPRAKVKALTGRFHKAVASVQSKIQQAQVETKQQQWQRLLGAVAALHQAELATLRNEPADSATESARAALTAVEVWPGNSRAILQRRLDTLQQLTAAQQADSVEQLAELQVRADILNGKESPAAERPLRMAYQMKILQREFGQSHHDSAADLLAAWLELVALEPALLQQSLERMGTVLSPMAKGQSMSS